MSGTERLQFLPFAQATHVHLSSPWPNPSFGGAFSPDAAPQVGPHGFAADWQVLEINRDYPQFWADDAVGEKKFGEIRLRRGFLPAGRRLSARLSCDSLRVAVHRADLNGLFLWEHTLGAPVHAMQYAMIGTALSVFYLVLTALSEHLDFAGSYALAAGAMTLLLAVFFSGLLKSRAAGLAAGALAGVCYSLLYLLVLSEEYALLFGALALFFVLAATMVATRKLDWYRVASSPRPGT